MKLRLFAPGRRVVAAAFLAFATTAASQQDAQAQSKLFGYLGSDTGYYAGLAKRIVETARGQDPTFALETISLDEFGGAENAITALHNGYVTAVVLPVYVVEKEVPELGVLGLPLLFHNLGEASKAAAGGGHGRLRKAAEAKGLTIVGYSWRVGTFASRVRCIARAEDVRGLSIIDGPTWYAHLINVAGGKAVRFPLGETSMVLSRGAAEGALLVIEVLADPGIVEASSCLTEVRQKAFMILPDVILTSTRGSAGMSATSHQSLVQAVRRTEQSVIEEIGRRTIELEAQYRKAGASGQGSKTVRFGGEEANTWQQAWMSVYAEFDKRVPDGARLRNALLSDRPAH